MSNANGSSAAAMPCDGRLRQRDQVRVAVHEADPAPVGDHLHDVARQQRARARVVQHRPAGEVAAAADQRQPVAEVARLALPQLDRVVRPHDPLAVGLVQVHRAARSGAPTRPCPSSSAGARSRSRRGRRAARSRVRGLVVQQRHAVPQHGRSPRRDEQRALADRERRLDADAVVAAVGPDRVAVLRRQPAGRRPLLAVLGHVLALVLADRAALRRRVGRCVLGAAGGADEGGHGER